MNVLIIGGGKPVFYLCRTFLAKGYGVTVVDRNEEDCIRLARRLKVTVIHGDGSDPAVLEEIEPYDYRAVLAVTPHDHDNLAVCQLARLKYRISRTVALVNDPDNVPVFRRLGVAAFSTINVIASMIEQQTALDEVISLIPVGEGQVNISELLLIEGSGVIGKTLADLSLPADSLVAVVLRDGSAIIPRGSTTLLTGDRIVLITLPGNHGRIIKMFTGEQT
jgi:trk system potassium uptake protein